MSTVMETENAQAPPQGGSIIKNGFRKVVFEIHRWEGRRKVKAIVQVLNGEAVDAERTTSARAKLIPEGWDKRLAKGRRDLLTIIERHTFPADLPGVRMVSITNSAPFVAEWDAAVKAYGLLADDFVGHYDEIVDYNRSFWRPRFANDEEYHEEVGRLIPSPAQMREKFAAEARLLDPDDAFAAKFEHHGIAKFFEIAQKNAEVFAAELEDAMLTIPCDRLASAMAEMQDKLKNNKVLTPESFSAVSDAVSLCMATADLLNPDVKAQVVALSTQVNKAIKTARTKQQQGASYTSAFQPFKTTLARAMDAVTDKIKASAGEHAHLGKFGHMPKGLFLGDQD